MKSLAMIHPDIPGLLSPARFIRNRVKKRLGHLPHGCIRIEDPWGAWYAGYGTDHDVEVTVLDPRFYMDLLLAGSNGVAGAWRDGFWACSDLTCLFEIAMMNREEMDKLESGIASIANIWLRWRHRRSLNTIAGSKKNISAHYDLSNEMFSLFLDETMTYSSGIFTSEQATMKQASVEKLDRICRKLRLTEDHHLLEIGSGWGSFAIHAATYYGCRITTTTISRQQYELARVRIREAGLDDRVDIQLCDYRDVQGQFDRIVSIEMIEAVGDKFLPLFFNKCASLLKVDGQLLIQSITMPDRRYQRYLKTSDFIQQFIFPGSCVPSVSALLQAAGGQSDLQIKHLEDIGLHYATTLRCWLEKFRSNEPGIRALGFGDDFLRLWEYYFCYCEAGFRQRYLGDVQIIFNRPACREENILGAL